jgi:hypothetical protein
VHVNETGGYDQFKDFTIWGLGGDIGTIIGHFIISVRGAHLDNVWTIGYDWNVVNTYTINGIIANDSILVNSGSYAGGNFPCALQNTAFPTVMDGAICGGANSAGLTLTSTNAVGFAGGISVRGCYCYGNTLAIYGVIANGTGVSTIEDSYIGGISASSGKLVVRGGSMDRFLANAPFTINNTGADISLENVQVSPQSHAFLNQSAGIFRDLGGNTGLNAPAIRGGVYSGNTSVTGTPQTSGNWSVPAGSGAGQWGTSPSVASCSGDSRTEQCIITVGSGTVGANPVLTITFPTAFQIAPLCDARMVGGTATFSNFTNGTINTTSAAFTYNGTPGASTTVVLKISCGN